MISSINQKVVWDFGGGEPTCISKALLFSTFKPAEVFSIALLNLELTLHFTFFFFLSQQKIYDYLSICYYI